MGFLFQCRSRIVCFLFYLSYITDGTSKWLFRLIINALTFYSNFMCFRNSIPFASRNEPILPAFLWVIIPCQDDKVQKCWSSPTSGIHAIVACFPEYLFSLFLYLTEENQEPNLQVAFSCPAMKLSFLLLQFLGLLMTQFQFLQQMRQCSYRQQSFTANPDSSSRKAPVKIKSVQDPLTVISDSIWRGVGTELAVLIPNICHLNALLM